jgi:hypothetical protein
LLDQYWALITKPIKERNSVVSSLPLYYAMNLNHIDQQIVENLYMKLEPLLEQWRPIFQEYATDRYNTILKNPSLRNLLETESQGDINDQIDIDDNEIWSQIGSGDNFIDLEAFDFPGAMLRNLCNYIVTLGKQTYDEILSEVEQLGVDIYQFQGLTELPILSALIDRQDPMFFINGQFRSFHSLIPGDSVIEGLPFQLQHSLVINSGIPQYFAHTYAEYVKVHPNISEEEARNTYSQILQYYLHNFSKDFIYNLFNPEEHLVQVAQKYPARYKPDKY